MTLPFFRQCFTLLALLILSGCATMFRETHSNNPSQEKSTDFAIQTGLDMDLLALDAALYHQICVKVFEGRVLLAGRVPTVELQQKAEDLTRKKAGVVKVFNYTTIGTSRDLSDYLADAWKSTEIASKLFFDGDLYVDHYTVETVDGTVYLLGKSASEAERTKVIEKARSLSGVKKVISLIEIRP